MKFLQAFCDFIESITTIKSNYIYLIIISLIIIFLIKGIRYFLLKISFKKNLNSKEKYMYNK